MGEYGREQRNQLSRAVANSYNGKKTNGNIDKRSHLVNQTILINSIQRESNSAMQMVLNKTVNSTNNRHTVIYRGVGYDFTGGQKAGNRGITGVKNYQARMSMEVAPHHWVPEYSPRINWNTKQYHRGHILSKSLGGSGDSDNIFKQDGGQNTTGDWPAFELLVSNTCRANPNKNFVFTAELTGNRLDYNRLI